MPAPEGANLRKPIFVLIVLAVLFVLTAAASADDPPRPLTDRALDNLTAFARLLSLVRFFHPSDAVAAADWNRVAVAGVAALEGAADPQSLAGALEDFFRPLAPTLRVRPQGVRPEIPAELRPPAGGKDARIVVWRHLGGAFAGDPKLYTSQRIDNQTPAGFGTVAQEVAAGALRGKQVRLRAWVRAEVTAGGRAQLGLRVDRAGGKPGFFDNMADRPIRDPAWRLYEIKGEVAPDAERIVVLLVMTGAGRVWLDEVSLDATDGAHAPLANAALDVGLPDLQPPGWYFPYESIRDGYHLTTRRGEACRRDGCAEIFSDEIAAPRFPRPEEVLETDLGGGVVAFLPVALYADDRGTLPHAAPGASAPPWKSVDAAADSRASRLAAILLAWGIFQHFHPELQPEDPAWSGALRPALAETALAGDREAFLHAAAHILVPLQDCRAYLWGPKSDALPQSLPLAWEWVEDRLVVTGAAKELADIHVGDTVVALDGRTAAERVAEEEARLSAATPESRRWSAVEDLLFGSAGSTVTLRLQRAGNAPFDVSVARVPWSENLPAGTPYAAVDEIRPGILYVDLRRAADDALQTLMPRMAAARGLIFDLRRGSNMPAELLSYLTDRTFLGPQLQTPSVMAPDHRGWQWMTTAVAHDPRTPRLKGRVAFLSDGRADVFKETLLSMVETYGLGEIVGDRSAGCSGMINRGDLPGGYRLGWSGRRALKRDGTNLHGVGVKPTVPAARTFQGIVAGRDEIVERAVEVLEKQIR
jgi:hypothetical protein